MHIYIYIYIYICGGQGISLDYSLLLMYYSWLIIHVFLTITLLQVAHNYTCGKGISLECGSAEASARGGRAGGGGGGGGGGAAAAAGQIC